MKITSSLIILVLSICLMTACKGSGNKTAGKGKQSAQQPKPAPKPTAPDTGRTVAKPVKDTAISDAKDTKTNDDDFSGKWISNNTSMHARINKSKVGYYVQFDYGSEVTFYGYYKLKDGRKGLLVCDKYNGDYDGQLENEYVKNSSFQLTDDKKLLVFKCDACETTLLHRVE